MPKFRVWDKFENRMCNVETIYIEDEWIKVNDGSIYGETKDLVRGHELMQWTGLIDRNDVKIYEGNIIKSQDGSDGTINTFIVRIDDSNGDFYPMTTDDIGYHTELKWVIGNIYENPKRYCEIK